MEKISLKLPKYIACVASHHNRLKMRGQYPEFLIPELFYPPLDHRPSCHLEIIKARHDFCQRQERQSASIFEVILPLPFRKKKNHLLKSFFNRAM